MLHSAHERQLIAFLHLILHLTSDSSPLFYAGTFGKLAEAWLRPEPPVRYNWCVPTMALCAMLCVWDTAVQNSADVPEAAPLQQDLVENFHHLGPQFHLYDRTCWKF